MPIDEDVLLLIKINPHQLISIISLKRETIQNDRWG